MRCRTVVLLVALAACSDKKQEPAPASAPSAAPQPPPAEPAPAPKKPATPPPSDPATGHATAAITLTGVVDKKLEGQIATCGQTAIKGKPEGMSVHIDTPELELAILATTEKELADPKVIVNVRQPKRQSFAMYPGKKNTVTLDKGVKATIDADLKAVVGKETIHVKGTVTCPPK
jgi:hypothetical protein